NKFGVPEQVAKARPIKAQSADIAGAMASICNAERARFGGMSGHGGFVHSLSDHGNRHAAINRQAGAIDISAGWRKMPPGVTQTRMNRRSLPRSKSLACA
ncbi:MAG: hypothetical protein LBQ32_05670, partial [Burkholderiaceae bacterium]|nr:hypothetical protein [Burkholderiaceae bacterium]